MTKSHFVAGIDYSMTSPAICVYDTKKKLCFDNTKVFIYSDKRKKGVYKNIFFLNHRPYDTQEERFDNISEWALSVLLECGVKQVCIEGYSMGSSKGLVFNIGENGGVLKHKLFKNKIRIEAIPAPTAVKKVFTGKGNAKKVDMYNALQESDNIDLIKLLDIKTKNPYESPIADIVDAYAMVYFLVKNMEN